MCMRWESSSPWMRTQGLGPEPYSVYARRWPSCVKVGIAPNPTPAGRRSNREKRGAGSGGDRPLATTVVSRRLDVGQELELLLCASSCALAFCETHLPKALLLLW